MTETATPATDAARRKAEQAGIAIEEIEGTGADGRITVADVEAEIEAQSGRATIWPARGLPPSEHFDADEDAAAAMDDRDHKQGCPARPERIEIYQARKPIRSEEGHLIRHDMVPVAHCLDCGETVLLEGGG